MGKFNVRWDKPDPYISLAKVRRRKRLRQIAIGTLAFIAVFLVGMLLTTGRGFLVDGAKVAGGAISGIFSGEPFTCSVASITDGDTFRCEETDEQGRAIRIRLSGVAARETDGTCSPGHPCPDASAEAATAALSHLARGQTLACQKVGETYGRVAAFCKRSDGVDLSCAMVESGTALKWWRYWRFHTCPALPQSGLTGS